MLRRLCRLVVDWFGPSWGRIGWLLFLFWLWVPNLFFRSPYYHAVTWLLDGLLFVWWLIDATKQCVNRTLVKLCTLLCLSCFVPHNSLPIILLWLFYWGYIRD